MASGQYGTQTLVQFGNAVSTTQPPGPPAIDSRVFTNFSSSMPPPSFARVPKMPKIERVTPSGVNAGLAIRNNAAKVRINLRKARNVVVQTIGGYGASAGLRRPAATYGFDETFKRFGRGTLKVVRPGPTPTTTATHVR